jgi:hypothetical protein
VQPRKTPKRGIITVKELTEATLEYLNYRPSDLPGCAHPRRRGVSIMRQGRLYAGGAYTGDGKTTIALQGTREHRIAGRQDRLLHDGDVRAISQPADRAQGHPARTARSSRGC